MKTIIEDLSVLTDTEAVNVFNFAQELLGRTDNDHVKKFKNQKIASARLVKAQDELQKMHNFAKVVRNEDNTLEWILVKPEPPKTDKVDTQRVGSTNLDLNQQLVLIHVGNPKRVGSRAHVVYEVYHTALKRNPEATGEMYIKDMEIVGFTRKLALSTLHWDIDHGFVKLGTMEPSTEPSVSDFTVSNDSTSESTIDDPSVEEQLGIDINTDTILKDKGVITNE